MTEELYLCEGFESFGINISIHIQLTISSCLPSAHQPHEISFCMKLTLVLSPLLELVLSVGKIFVTVFLYPSYCLVH